MANVTVKAVMDFRHKREPVKRGDTLSVPVKLASVYANLGYVKLDSETTAKVEKLEEKMTSAPDAKNTATKKSK